MALNLTKLKQDLFKLQRRCENAKGRLEEAFAARAELERKINEIRLTIEAKNKKIEAIRGEIERLRQDYEKQRESLLLPLLGQIEELTRENQAKNKEAESRSAIQNQWQERHEEYLAAAEEVEQLKRGSNAITNVMNLWSKNIYEQFLKTYNKQYPLTGSRDEKIAWIEIFVEVLKTM